MAGPAPAPVVALPPALGTDPGGAPFQAQNRAKPGGKRGRKDVHSIFYIIGVVVVVLAILSLVGLA
jgi:hypothetical protein